MKYKISDQIIPQNARKELNDKILYLIDNSLTERYNITNEDIFNSYTGEGGLHGLEFNNYNSFYEFTQAKKEIEQGQFFTPHNLSKFLVDCLKPSEHDMIIDLTSGMGNFFNYLPNELNVFGNELDMKAYKISKFLYPNANITNQDIRNFNTDIQFDLVLGNPPFNLRWSVNNNEYLSQLYFCMKSYEVLKPGAVMALIVPKSFLNDEFSDSGMIKEINYLFNFICQFELPSNSFQSVGVSNFQTKIIIFQKKSEHITEKPYNSEYITAPSITETGSTFIYNNYIQPLYAEKDIVKNKLMLEALRYGKEEEEFQYKVKKLLFDIRRNPKINKYYSKCESYLNKLYTQKMPDGMQYEEWQKVRVTKNKVIRYLKDTLKKQHKKPEKDITALVKNRYGLFLKAYSTKENKMLKAMNGVKEISFNEMILNGEYPFSDDKYLKLYNRKLNEHQRQSKPFSEMEEDNDILQWLKNYYITDHDNNNIIKLNDIQKLDTMRMLQKNHGYLQWQQGSGKSISALFQIMYRFAHNNIKNAFIVAPAIAIKNTFNQILKSYKMDYIMINKLSDIDNIKDGQIVIVTFRMLSKYQKQIKKFIKIRNRKVMLCLDEADSISNLSSQTTKSVLNVFQKVDYKLLCSGTSTRNTISEAFPQLLLMYGRFICKCEEIYVENIKTKEVEKKVNPDYMKPFPAYKKGETLFKRCFVPEKTTVFGVTKTDQSIYSSDVLKEIINYTFITRSFNEVSGKDLYKIVQNTCEFNNEEKQLYRVIIDEFYKIVGMYRSTGNARKDAILKVLKQLNSLLLASSLPTEFKEYKGDRVPSKANKMIKIVKQWDNEIVSIGCNRIKTVNSYANILRNSFPNRKIFIITGESTTLQQRRNIIDQLKESKNGILICTMQSLSSSMSIDFVNRVLLVELSWNFSQISQHFFRYIRYTSTEPKEIHFLTVKDSIESNLLKLILNKEILSSFMRNENLEDEDLYEKFGIDFDLFSMLMSKEIDNEGKSYIAWNEQKII